MDDAYQWLVRLALVAPVLALVGSMIPPIRRGFVRTWRKVTHRSWPTDALRIVPMPATFHWSPGGSRDEEGKEYEPIAWLRGDFQITAITDDMTSVPAATVRVWPSLRRLDCLPPSVGVTNEAGMRFGKLSTDWPLIRADPDPQMTSVELSIEAVLDPRPNGVVHALVTLIDNFNNKHRFRVRFQERN